VIECDLIWFKFLPAQVASRIIARNNRGAVYELNHGHIMLARPGVVALLSFNELDTLVSLAALD